MLFKATPLLNIIKYINAIKTITSMEIHRNFPDVKNELYNNKFWLPSYSLATSDQVTFDVLKRYVDPQEVKRHEGI
jgi:putative transposase